MTKFTVCINHECGSVLEYSGEGSTPKYCSECRAILEAACSTCGKKYNYRPGKYCTHCKSDQENKFEKLLKILYEQLSLFRDAGTLDKKLDVLPSYAEEIRRLMAVCYPALPPVVYQGLEDKYFVHPGEIEDGLMDPAPEVPYFVLNDYWRKFLLDEADEKNPLLGLDILKGDIKKILESRVEA